MESIGFGVLLLFLIVSLLVNFFFVVITDSGTDSDTLELAGDTWILSINVCGVSNWTYIDVLNRPHPVARWSHASAVVHGSKLIISGGYSYDEVLSDCWMLGRLTTSVIVFQY